MAFDGTNLIFATDDELRLQVGTSSTTYRAWPTTFVTSDGAGGNYTISGMMYDGTYLWVCDAASNLFQIDLDRWLTSPNILPESSIALPIRTWINNDITYDGIDLIVLDGDEQIVNKFDGISNTLKSTFAVPAPYYYARNVEWVAGELILVDQLGSDTTVILDGFSSTILSTFSNDSSSSYISFVGTNLMSVNQYTGTVFTHQGISPFSS